MPKKITKTRRAREKLRRATTHVLCRLPDPPPMKDFRARTYAIYPGMSGAYLVTKPPTKPGLAFIQRDEQSGFVVLPACTCAPGECPVSKKAMTQVNRLGIESTTYLYVKAVQP